MVTRGIHTETNSDKICMEVLMICSDLSWDLSMDLYAENARTREGGMIEKT